MKLDKELYRQAHVWYREWNQAKLIARARNVGKRLPREGWEQYLSLHHFYRQMRLKPSDREREQKLAALEQYYYRVERMEAWRRTRGRGN